MALQHFYSRVPARVSMYNKADGFDTFAHSAGLEREFIERELSIVYENKLSKNDTTMVRKGEHPTVYSQCCVRSGQLVQCCTTYLPLDYTGERSAYLSHSLIFDEEEQTAILCGKDHAVFNPDMFVTDISSFQISASDATANNQYPLLKYVTREEPGYGIIQKYDSETVKSFIYAVILALCGKGKNVFFKLPGKNAEISENALAFINEVMMVLPFHMRETLSFVTYVTDYTQYPSFKLKGVAPFCSEIPASKGVYFDLQTGLVVGLQHDEVVANKSIINFFYSMFENTHLRSAFLTYMDRAVQEVPGLRSMNLKTLTDLVFLFCATSGMFPESATLPNDSKIFDFLGVYKKYRSALSDKYRVNAYRFLKRYPKRHEAIPKNVFSTVTRLYPTEVQPARRMIMSVILELIHTDIMRDKLFTFIRNSYADEDPDIRQIISEDLSRVFYGGFLQTQILEFFSCWFTNESVYSRDQIIDKLLLSIRTVAVQKKILEFLDKHYDDLTVEQKEKFYRTFFEMLPECDALSGALIELVNRHIGKEPEEVQANVGSQLAAMLEADYRKKEHLMLPLLVDPEGFSRDMVLRLIFDSWNARKAYSEYLELLAGKPVYEKTATVIQIFKLVPDMSDQIYKRFISALPDIYRTDKNKGDLYSWLEADALIQQELTAVVPELCTGIREHITYPAICEAVHDAFNVRLRKNGIELVRECAKTIPAVSQCPQYRDVLSYQEMLRAVQENQLAKALEIYDSLPENEQVRKHIAGHIDACVSDRTAHKEKETFVYDLIGQCLKNGKPGLDTLYKNYGEVYRQQYYEQHRGKNQAEKAAHYGAAHAMSLLMERCEQICHASAEFKQMICSENSGIKTAIHLFTQEYGKGAEKWLRGLHFQYGEAEGFGAYARELIQSNVQQSTSFFKRLFGGK